MLWFQKAARNRYLAHHTWFMVNASLILAGVVVNALEKIPLNAWATVAMLGLLSELVFLVWRRHPLGAGLGVSLVCLAGICSTWGWFGQETGFLTVQERVGLLAVIFGSYLTMLGTLLFSVYPKSVVMTLIARRRLSDRALLFPILDKKYEKWTRWEWVWFFHVTDPLMQALHRERVLEQLPKGQYSAPKKRL